MGKGTKKIIAVVCAIALVISSMTVYSKKVSAETDYASLNYSTITCTGNNSLSLDYCVVSNNLLGFANVWYGDGGNTFQITFSGDVTSENYTITLNGEEPATGVVTTKGNGLIKINPNVLADNSYHDILITRTDENQTLNIVIKKGTPEGGEPSGETTTPEPTTAFDPASIEDWTALTGSSTIKYYKKEGAVNNGPNNQGTRIHMGLASAAFKSITWDGEINDAVTTEGSGVFVPMTLLTTAGYYTLHVEYNDGNADFTMIFKVEEETTTQTTTEATTEATTDEDGYKSVTAEQKINDWTLFAGANVNWGGGKISEKGTREGMDLAIRVDNATTEWWGIQAKYHGLEGLLDASKTYNVIIKFNASKAGKLAVKLDGYDNNDGVQYDIVAGENTITKSGITGVTTITPVFALIGTEVGTIIDFTEISATEHVEESSTEETTPEPTTIPEGLVTDCETSDALSVEGFQIKVNDNDTSAKTGFRVIIKVPKNLTIDGHQVDHFGTVYTLDDNNTGEKSKNVYNKYYTILDETPVTGKDWEYEGVNNGNRTVGYAKTAEANLKNWNPSDADNDYYAMTMTKIDSAILEHTIFVRPYFVDTEGKIVYASKTISTSMARVASDLYVNSKMGNNTAHNYLFNNILSSSYTQHSIYHRTTPIEYGWGQSVYKPTTEAP